MVKQLCTFPHLRNWGSLSLIGIISIFMLTGCNDASTQKNKAATNVSVISAKEVSVTPSKDFVVRTSAVDSVNLQARVQGYLTQRNFKEGSLVKKGQLLYKIDPTQYKISVKQAQAQLDSNKAKNIEAQRNLKRGENLIKKKLISQETYDGLVSISQQDKASAEASKAALAQAQLNLSYTDVTAPFDGMIGQTNYHVGSLVGPSDSNPLAEVTSISPIYVSFQVNEQDFLKYFPHTMNIQTLKKSLDFTLTLSDGTVYPEHGTLNFVSPKVDTDTDTITLRTSFANPNKKLRPGMYATMRVSDTESHTLPEIPQTAIQHGKDGIFVYVVEKNSKAEEKPVTLGPQINAFQSIMKGVNVGDKVVIQGFMKIKKGKTVNAKEVQLDAQGSIIPASTSDSTKQSS